MQDRRNCFEYEEEGVTIKRFPKIFNPFTVKVPAMPGTNFV